MRPISFLSLGLSLCAASGAAFAQTPRLDENLVTPRSMGLGGQAIAAATSTAALYSNPAAMGLSRVYHVDSTFLYDPTVERYALGGAIVDSTRAVGMGLSYVYGNTGLESRDNHDLRLSLGILLTEGVSLGATVRYMNYGGAASTNTTLGPSYGGVTVDVGVAVRPWSFISLGAVAYSITNPDTSQAPLTIGGGVALNPLDSLTLVFDTTWDMRSYDAPRMRMSGGAELMLSRIPLRAGYIWDEGRGTQAATVGAGYIGDGFGIEGSLRQEVVGGNQTTMMFALRYFYRAF